MTHPRLALRLSLVLLVVVAAAALWQTSGLRRARGLLLVRTPRGVMGTSCRLVAQAVPGGEPGARRALEHAERELRRQEMLLSEWIVDSEISRFNRALAGVEIPLSPDAGAVLRAAHDAHAATAGAFDVTCRPLILLWRDASRAGREPSREAVDRARAESGWAQIALFDEGATKVTATAQVDLGGIAKGHAVDRALALLRAAPAIAAAMVEVGGDLAGFGRRWTIDVRHPSGRGVLGRLALEGDASAVCTSGDYARPVDVANRRHNHIVDPRTGAPADGTASVTVVASRCIDADIWATALSVLGEPGLDRLPADMQALLVAHVAGEPARFRLVATPGFASLWVEPPKEPVAAHVRRSLPGPVAGGRTRP